MLNRALLNNCEKIFKYLHDDVDYFPGIQKSHITTSIKNKTVIYDSGVIIVYKVVKRKTKLGKTYIPKNSIIIRQLLNLNRDDKKNNHIVRVIKEFFAEMNSDVFLVVDGDNLRAMSFYYKNNFEVASQENQWLVLKRDRNGNKLLHEN